MKRTIQGVMDEHVSDVAEFEAACYELCDEVEHLIEGVAHDNASDDDDSALYVQNVTAQGLVEFLLSGWLTDDQVDEVSGIVQHMIRGNAGLDKEDLS